MAAVSASSLAEIGLKRLQIVPLSPRERGRVLVMAVAVVQVEAVTQLVRGAGGVAWVGVDRDSLRNLQTGRKLC